MGARTFLIGFALGALGCGGSTPPTTTADDEAAQEQEAAAPPRPLTVEEAARAQTQATQTHIQARAAQERCTDDRDEGACQQARNLFMVAADTWNALVQGRPDDEGVVDWSFMHAQALFHAGRHVQAAEAAARYLTSGTNEAWRREAAEILVEGRTRAFENEDPTVRSAPPEPQGQPPAVQPIDLPAPLASLVEARALYVEAVPEDDDPDQTRRAHALENALVQYRYGLWDEARPALRSLFEAHCGGDSAWEGAARAWRALREMSIALGRYDAVEALGAELEERHCHFGTASPACGGDDEDPRCIARTDAVSGRLRTGITLLQRARHSRPSERARWANNAGDAFLAAIEQEARMPAAERVAALVQAAGAYRMARNADKATEVDRRIVDEVDPARFDGEQRPQVVQAVAGSLSRLLAQARRSSRHEDVVRVAGRLLTDDFDLPELADERTDAQAMLPRSLAALERHREAAEAWQTLAESLQDPAQKRDASLAAALALVEAGDCRRGGTALRNFAREHRGQEGATDAVVRALYTYATCQREGSRARQAAMDDVAAAAGETRDALSAESKGYAAAATFAIVDRDFDRLERLRIAIPRGENTEAIVEALREELREPAAQVRDLVAGYDRVVAFEDPRWSAAAHHRAGLAFERLASIVLEATWRVPEDLEAQRRELNDRAFEQLRGIVDNRVQEIRQSQARPILCRAAQRHHAATRAAQRASIESEEAELSRERLTAIGEAVVRRCRSASPGAFR